MRIYLSIILLTFFITSCQKDKLIEEELQGEWSYERSLSVTFNNLSDYDLNGTIIFNPNNVGFWNDTKGEYNYNIEWYFDEALQTIEIFKYDQDQNFELAEIVKFNLIKENNQTFIMEFQEEKPSVLDPEKVFVYFEKIELTRK